jgi:tetratricopeptide (TPR) repeat protein
MRSLLVAVGFLVLLSLSPLLRAETCGSTRYDCAAFYIENHRLAIAVQVLNDELRVSPGNLKALNLLGIALTESGQVEQANQKFRDALAIDARFYPARKNLAINEFNAHRVKVAAVELQHVLKDSPSDPVAHLYVAEIDYQESNFVVALAHYQKVDARISSNPIWVLHYAHCLVASGKVSQARAVLRSLPVADADDRFQAGLMLARSGAYADAAELFATARNNYADPYVAGYNQLLMLIRAERYTEGIELFNQLVKDGYERADLYNLVSEAYLKHGDLKQAYDSLRTATKLNPTAEDNYVDLAALCLDDEAYDLGLEVLDVGIHYVPNSYRLYVQRGFMLVMRGRMQDAEKQFQLASTLAPDKSLPYIALGEVWMQLGEAQKAADLLRTKSRAPGADFLIPYVFAEALIRSGTDAGTSTAEEAIHALERSIELNSKYPHSHAELGKLLLKQGEIDHAIPELRLATKLDPDDSGSLYQLGLAYRKKGEKSKAEEMLARVVQLHSPEHEQDVRKELRRLVKQETASVQMEARP